MTNSHSKARNSPNKQKQHQFYNASFEGSPRVSNSSPNQKKNGSFFANNRKSSDTLMTSSNAINSLQTPYKYNNSFNNNNSNISPNSSRSSSQRASAPISIMGSSPTRTSPTKFYQNNNNNSNNNSFNGSCSPSNPDYFAGSKCFDAPKPDELPKPPSNWFGSCSAEFGKQSKIRNLPFLQMTA